MRRNSLLHPPFPNFRTESAALCAEPGKRSLVVVRRGYPSESTSTRKASNGAVSALPTAWENPSLGLSSGLPFPLGVAYSEYSMPCHLDLECPRSDVTDDLGICQARRQHPCITRDNAHASLRSGPRSPELGVCAPLSVCL